MWPGRGSKGNGEQNANPITQALPSQLRAEDESGDDRNAMRMRPAKANSAITPALSVLSANEGLKVVYPGLAPVVLPLTVGVLTALFAAEHWGTDRIGHLFGPVMLVWFGALALAGLRVAVQEPAIRQGLSPAFAVEFMTRRPLVALVAMGAVVLAVTGAEALYADMGHFGRAPIRLAWVALVFPALTLNYLGQAGLILHHPAAIRNPFYLLLPSWSRAPMETAPSPGA